MDTLYLKDFQAKMFIFGMRKAGSSHILKTHIFFLKEYEKCSNLYCLHAAMSLPVYELLGWSCSPKYLSKCNIMQ